MGKLRNTYERLKILFNIYSSKSGIMPENVRYPITLELTSICNLSCPLCPVALDNYTLERGRKYLSEEDFNSILKLTYPVASAYIMNMWGEPLFHKQFFEFWNKVSDKPTWVSTNLNYSEKHARKLAECDGLNVICSLDGYDIETYKEYRKGGKFDVMTRNLRIVAEGKCIAWPQFLINEKNKENMELMYNFVNEMGIDRKNVITKPMLMNFKNEMTEVVDGACHSLHQGFYFTVDGHLNPCCVNVGSDLNIDHVSNIESTQELLNGKKVLNMRKNLAKDKNLYPSCKACPGYLYQESISNSVKSNLKRIKQHITSAVA